MDTSVDSDPFSTSATDQHIRYPRCAPAHFQSCLQTLKEAQFINKSLSFLEQTVNALVRRDAHVSFRQTKLTSVLRDALGGNCKVRSGTYRLIPAFALLLRHSGLDSCLLQSRVPYLP
jgi:hypothetical protein